MYSTSIFHFGKFLAVAALLRCKDVSLLFYGFLNATLYMYIVQKYCQGPFQTVTDRPEKCTSPLYSKLSVQLYLHCKLACKCVFLSYKIKCVFFKNQCLSAIICDFRFNKS